MKKKVDILKTKIPNVCFSLADILPKKDKRLKEFKKQRIERGFDNSELWNLDVTIAKFILPRLIAFKNTSHSLDLNIIDKMIFAFNIKAYGNFSGNDEDNKKCKEGIKLFCEYFDGLWS